MKPARGHKRNRGRPPFSMAALRCAELSKLFRHRWGEFRIPNADEGRLAVKIMLHHLAKRHADPMRIRKWMAAYAPWMPQDESNELIRYVLAKPLRWRADRLAKELNVTEAERRRLRIRSIGAVDMTKEQRKQQRRLEQQQRSRRNRQERARKRGRQVRSRNEYEATSISRTKPWLAAGISRRTWYRQRGTSAFAI
jgi:hypothetical protein